MPKIRSGPAENRTRIIRMPFEYNDHYNTGPKILSEKEIINLSCQKTSSQSHKIFNTLH